jgi:hypothetical protein
MDGIVHVEEIDAKRTKKARSDAGFLHSSCRQLSAYSHSIVAGGLPEMS